MTTQCLLALGSNLGDREQMLRGALAAIGDVPEIRLLRHSRFYRTTPVGGPAGQGEFLNAAALVETELQPLALLGQLQQIETTFGRERGEHWAARTLDLDLLLYGDVVIDVDELIVPHPRMTSRRFVLEPAAEIAGEMVHPHSGMTISQLLRDLPKSSPI